ncbi:DUF397 domain-containing protein [Actinomadura syzygii]|uniref:DUF397 domain-containing protein n=1 Tax=Actinomadura syzygii TaxID=1427538 RepID=A0A5D0UKV3_9ACTN|nr:DUF397 domain-containing protein [Actinomadura syzygii]TYC18724.1 DUF397 domain-containing protein [Actinomadura syzygii]
MDLSNVMWRKASRSTENGGDCVELGAMNDSVAIRDSKNPEGPKLIVSRNDFRHFAESLKGLGL